MPLIVIVLLAHAAVTPAGKPVTVPMPVATVVVWVIFVNAVLIQSVGLELATLVVLFGLTVTIRVVAADGPLQPKLTTLIVTEPDQPLGQVSSPVDELIAPTLNVPDVLEILLKDQASVPFVVVLL